MTSVECYSNIAVIAIKIFFRDIMHVYSQGLSKRADEKLLWKGSSHSGFAPFIDTHLKQSIERALGMDEKKFKLMRTDVMSIINYSFYTSHL